jgi:hypothetical protein
VSNFVVADDSDRAINVRRLKIAGLGEHTKANLICISLGLSFAVLQLVTFPKKEPEKLRRSHTSVGKLRSTKCEAP